MWTLQETASNLESEHCPSGAQKCLISADREKEHGLGESERWAGGSELDLCDKAINHFLELRSLEKSYIGASFS